jgi:hypothetical protein
MESHGGMISAEKTDSSTGALAILPAEYLASKQ